MSNQNDSGTTFSTTPIDFNSSQSSLRLSLAPGQSTIINVESYPEHDEITKPMVSPRMKQMKKIGACASNSAEKNKDYKTRCGSFNEFLEKMEKYQKSKNDKISALQTLKKEQEESKLRSIPKVKMSEKSRKILDSKKKKNECYGNTSVNIKPTQFTSSPNSFKASSTRNNSNSSKALLAKTIPDLAKTSEILAIKPFSLETPSLVKSEKVLASKFIKEFNNKFDEISGGRISITEQETRKILKSMFFIDLDSENLIKTESEERLFTRMWKISTETDSKVVTMNNLRTFLLAVMNYYLSSISHNEEEVSFGRMISGKLYFNQAEVIRIHQMFFSFYENRNSLLTKISQQKRIDKLTQMEELFKNFKSKETKISYGPGKLIENVLRVPEKKNREDPPRIKLQRSGSLKKKINECDSENPPRVKLRKSASVKKRNNEIDRENLCKTPNPSKIQENLNTSFRAARSKSRSGRDSSARSSISENEETILSNDRISDPSILLKAQDLLGVFSSIAKKESKKDEALKKENKVVENWKKENKVIENGKKEEYQNEKVSKLVYKKKNSLNSIRSQTLDKDLQKVADLLKNNNKKVNEDILVDVNMPDGSLKILAVPFNANKRQIVQRFVRENNLSPEMGRTLLDSINNS